MVVLTEQNPYLQYMGDGVTTFFAVTFTMIEDSTLLVFQDTVSSDYQLVEGGIEIVPAPGVGVQVEIYRSTEISQLRDFQAQEAFKADKTESALDKLILLKQESAFNIAVMNLTSLPMLDKVTLNNDIGTNADILIWNVDTAGVFAGEVAQTIPNAGDVVAKPENFVYFGFGDPPAFQVLTSTLYPIEVIESAQIGANLTDDTFLRDIETDELDYVSDVLAVTITDVKLTYGPDQDDLDYVGNVVAVTITDIKLSYGPDTDSLDYVSDVLAVTVKPGKVDAFAPEEEIQIGCTLSESDCYMMDEP